MESKIIDKFKLNLEIVDSQSTTDAINHLDNQLSDLEMSINNSEDLVTLVDSIQQIIHKFGGDVPIKDESGLIYLDKNGKFTLAEFE